MNFETLDVQGFDPAIYGMRNPLKSHDKIDSDYLEDYYNCNNSRWLMGPNDYDLAKRLCKAGSEHRKFLQMVQVWVNITAPRYFWSEFDTYRVGVVKNSESTMHTLKKDGLTQDCVEFEWGFDLEADETMTNLLLALQSLQKEVIENKEYSEHYHRIMKALLPEGFLQKRTVNVNYETLGNMYRQRKNHRLPEWSVDFVEWVKSLPYSEFITMEFDD